MHDYLTKLENLNLADYDTITLTYSDGCDVFHYKDGGGVEDAIDETNTISKFSKLVYALQQNYEGVHPILLTLDDNSVISLDDYVEETEDEDAEPTYNIDSLDIEEGIRNSFFEQEFIESEVKRYDHKRGYCTLTAKVEVQYSELKEAQPNINLQGWSIEVNTPNGLLTFAAA